MARLAVDDESGGDAVGNEHFVKVGALVGCRHRDRNLCIGPHVVFRDDSRHCEADVGWLVEGHGRQVDDKRQGNGDESAVERESRKQQNVDQYRDLGRCDVASTDAACITGTATMRSSSETTSSAAWRSVHRSGSRISRWAIAAWAKASHRRG